MTWIVYAFFFSPDVADTHFSYSLSTTDIKNDLTPGQGRPEWVFSCYGPGRNAPKQLFEGPQREQSFEELRLRHYEAAATGSAEQAVQEAQMLYAEAVKQMEIVLSDLDGAVKYILQGANEHPNRIDITEGQTGPTGPTGPSGFAQPSPFGQQPQTSPTPAPAFGQPSAPGGGLGGGTPAFGKPSGFGQPSAFGQPSMPGQASGFGQPSALGQGSSGFGQPSTLGQSPFGKPAFGQSSFGQPSAFGQPSMSGQLSGFGQPSSLSQGSSGFGQPSLGQPSAPASGFWNASGVSPFSQISNQNQQSAGGFGQPSALASNSPFAQVAQQQQQQQQPQQAAPTGFGQPSAAPQGPTGFGQPSQAPSPFAQAQNQPAPFGQPSTAPNPFGAQAQQPSGFGQPSAAPQGPTGFGQTAAPAAPAAPGPAPTQTATAGTGPPAIIKVDTSTELNPIPPLNGQTVRDPMTKRLSMWKGQPVQYIEGVPCYLHPQDRQTPVRIFFPDGPPEQASLRDAQGKQEEYSPEVVEQYEFFVQNGYFKDGVIPSVPPKTEWVSFDF